MQAGEEGAAPPHDMALQESPGTPDEHTEQQSDQLEATFEQRFEQFYLQLSEGKTGGMVVSERRNCYKYDTLIVFERRMTADLGKVAAGVSERAKLLFASTTDNFLRHYF